VAEKLRGKPKSEAEAETSPGVLLASGYIAGGTLCGLIVAFFVFLPDSFNEAINLGMQLFATEKKDGKWLWDPDKVVKAKIASAILFGLLGAFLMYTGIRKEKQPPT
jgi:hypothetical protein